MSGKIYIIRHGITLDNKKKSLQGQRDTHLNGQGLIQAERLAEYFTELPLDAIYCSPLIRAKETANPLARIKGLPLNILEDLKEVNFGSWEGVEMQELDKLYPEEMHNFIAAPSKWRAEGAETFAEAQERVWQAFKETLHKEGNGRNLAFVTHGGAIRLLMGKFLEMDLDKIWKISVYNTSITTIYEWDGHLVLEELNRTV